MLRSVGLLLFCLTPFCGSAGTFALTGVDFSTLPSWAESEDWHQTAISLRYSDENDEPLNTAELTLTLAYRDGDEAYQFYARTVRFIPPREACTVFLYLPPDVVERPGQHLPEEPFAWAVRLSYGDNSPVEARSDLLKNDEVFASFQQKAQAANREFLLPIDATPFGGYPHEEHLRRSPTYLQEDAP